MSGRASSIPAVSIGAASTRAVVSFSGFSRAPALHLAILHDGHPAAVAWRLALALCQCGDGESFLAAFRRCRPEPVVLTSAAEAADADYRYALRLLVSTKPAADLARSLEAASMELHPGVIALREAGLRAAQPCLATPSGHRERRS